MQNPHLNKAHEIAEALAAGKLIKFEAYGSSENPTEIYELTLQGETYEELRNRKAAAVEELKKVWTAQTEDEAKVMHELLASWSSKLSDAPSSEPVRGPVFTLALPDAPAGVAERVFTLGNTDPQECPAAYVRGLRQVEKMLVSGTPKVVKSSPKTILKHELIARFLDKGHPSIFQIKVTADTKFEVLPSPAKS